MPWTTEALLDVNVLIASVFQDHPHFARASRFVQHLDRFYTCPTTQGGFLRFATRPWKDLQRGEQPPRLSMAEAHGKLLELASVPGHGFLADSLPFTEVPLWSMSGHRQWTDAYLLRLALRHNLRFVSFDRRMSNLDDPRRPALLLVP
ncbi:MAG: PIN domain-containing protein [Verrucomicrobiales bacterium]|nr:PIN domain-containing protein [Verrucomicrobiales bacterium]MCP5527302.1 PIN domain-containing protein [Verrucomicrobiales bacterium]